MAERALYDTFYTSHYQLHGIQWTLDIPILTRGGRADGCLQWFETSHRRHLECCNPAQTAASRRLALAGVGRSARTPATGRCVPPAATTARGALTTAAGPASGAGSGRPTLKDGSRLERPWRLAAESPPPQGRGLSPGDGKDGESGGSQTEGDAGPLD